MLVGEQQAPALHCVFSSACAAVGLPCGPDGPGLYIGSSAETAIYCVRTPLPARGAPASSPEGSAVPPSVAAAARQHPAAHLQRSSSAPPTAELHNTVPGGAEQQSTTATEVRPHSGGGPAAPVPDASINLQLDRSRWRCTGGAATGGKPAPWHQASLPATRLAVVITGALVDLLQVSIWAQLAA
jgi:hypothetical protein